MCYLDGKQCHLNFEQRSGSHGVSDAAGDTEHDDDDSWCLARGTCKRLEGDGGKTCDEIRRVDKMVVLTFDCISLDFKSSGKKAVGWRRPVLLRNTHFRVLVCASLALLTPSVNHW